MYVRQSDSENRPSRASAFNVRRTIEKRQIQQERRERKALREQIREQLRSLSEGRERKDSSGSLGSSVHLSQNSVRSKSMSSLDQDDDFRSESPLFKVQSSPTLEKEKEGVRSYLFGATNLTESGESSCAGIPKTKEEPKVIRRERDNTECGSGECKEVQERPKTYAFERPDLWQWTQSWDSLKTAQQEVRETKTRSVSKSVDSVQGSNKESVSSLRDSKKDQKAKKAGKAEQKLPNRTTAVKDSPDADCSFISPRKESELCEKESLASVEQLDPPDASARPVPPPRRKKLSLSAGHITLEAEEKPNWIRLAKERRSLRSTRQVEDLSDRASTTASKEPEWVARARKKLEALNVTLTSTTDFHSVSSHVTESSSAWSRGGLDALDDLREETSRIGEELAEEASARVNEDLGIKDSSRMLEHNTERSREPSAERPRVSFDASSVDATETADSSRRYRTRKSQKDEVRFGDLKHDWGGVQSKSKNSGGKQKEMRFGEIQVKETLQEPPSPEKSKEMRFGDHMKSQPSQKTQNLSSSASGTRPVMRFGDTPLNLFPAPEAKVNQNSSKFESIAGPDPTKMTAEQLNQNVEEYDFPIPTGKEDASELMRFLEESLRKTEVVPEVVTVDDHRPKPKSILKRRSVENVLHELKREEKCEWLQKVEHRKSASFDWDSVGKGAEASLDTGHTRHSGSHHKPSRDHHSQHPIDLMNNNSSNNNFNNFHNKQLHDNLTTTTAPTMATNGSFFNVKLRHVSSNKREQPSLTNDHTLRFHLEQLQHRRSHGTADTHAEDVGDVPCRASQGQRGIRRGSRGGDSHGSSSASSQESLSDTGGGAGEGGRVVGHYRTGEEEEEEEGRREEKKEEVRRRSSSRTSIQGLENGKARRDRSRAEAKRERDFKRCEKEEKEEHMEGKRDTRLREVLHRVSEPPASSWGSCRTGRSFSATELQESVLVSSESSLVSRPDQEDRLSTSPQEESSQGKDRISEAATETTDEKNAASEPLPNDHPSEAPDSSQKSSDPHSLEASVTAVLTPQVEEEDDSRNESPKSEGVPPREVISTGSQQGRTPQKHTPHKTYIASYHLTSLSSYKSFPDAPTASSPAPAEQGDSPAQASEERSPPGARKEVQSSGTFVSQHTMEIQGAKSPAKVFSFTFSPAQTTRPETVLADFEGPSIIPAYVREEVEVEKEEVGEEKEREEEISRKVQEKNVHRSDGRRVFTVVTNPNDVRKNSEKTNTSISSAAEGSSSKSRNIKINIQNEKTASLKSPEIPAKPSWMKLVTQNLSNSSERRRSEDKVQDGSSSKTKVQQVTVEVVDDEEPRKRRSAKEDERRRSSLMEWEALQRQRLEDEERNRINKNLSMKPVSTKIKELVKMHGSFMSMFSKDKKTDINGTVDGKDDIVFRKVTSENSSYELNNEAVKDTTVPMKSPYIVRKLLSPLKQPSPQEVTPPQRVSRKDATKGTSSSHKSPRLSRRDNSKSRLGEGRRDASPHKSVSENNRESVSMNGHHRHSSSSPSSRYRKTSIKDSSPLESSSRSRDRESSTRSSRVSQSPSRNPEVKARHKDAAHTPKSPRKASTSVDSEEKSRTYPSSKEGKVKELKPQREEHDTNGEASESSNSFSYERRKSEGRSSIKDPQKRKEWLNRMLNTISSDHLSVLEDKDQMSSENHPQPPPSPRKTHDRQLDVKDVPSAELKDSASLDPPAPSSPAPTPPARKSSSKGLSADLLTSTPNKPKFTSSYLSSQPLPSSPLSPTKPAIPTKPASITLNKPSVVASEVPASSAKLSPSLPDTPSSLRSSLRDTLQSDSSYRRGPVSLSSILGDQSSRSSSRTSTPLTSPRATPERVIKKDSLDQVPKLDVIPESSLRSSVLKAPESVGKATESVLRSPELALKAPESVLRASETALRTAESFTSAVEATLRTADSDLKAPESVLRTSDSRTPESVPRVSESVPRASELVSRVSDSVLRSSGRRSDPSCGEDQKENIAPSPSPIRCTEAKANKVTEEGRTSSNFSPSSYRSSFRLKEKSEERREEDKKVSAKNNANSSWRPSSYKPFTFGKPSVTLKAMTTGVDPQRVSTSKNSNTKREEKTDTFTSRNLHAQPVPEEPKAINRKTSRAETNSSQKKEDQISTRFSAERRSLRSRISTNDMQKTEHSTTKSHNDRASSSQGTSSTFTRYSKDRTSLRSRELSERSTPDRDSSGPVSLSSILTKDVAPRTSTDEEPKDFQFKPNLSFSDELNDITLKYRKDLTTRRPSSDATHDDDDDDVFSRNDPTRGSSVEPDSKEPSPARETKPKSRDRRASKDGATHTPGRASKESSPAPKGLPKSSSGSSSRPKTTKLVRRNSSLKRSRPEEAGATSRTTAKKERKDSEDEPADLKSESIVQDPSGWTKTKTTVRRARLGSFEKTRQIARTNSGRNKKEKTFKMDASKQLEDWAAGTKVQGKLMKKEGQRFSHETEEEVKGGQRTSKSVVRRVVRRGSRRLSGGGELLTETKETSSAGAKKEGQSDKPDASARSKGDAEGGQQLVTLTSDDGLSRKMKTSTDGEEYMTQSVSSKDGKTTFTTEGVNNKTTNSVEVIGGEDFEAKRRVRIRSFSNPSHSSEQARTSKPSAVSESVPFLTPLIHPNRRGLRSQAPCPNPFLF
ncbi:serine-rich adhesin for platelets isoform X3 [Penaeus vannamei]